MQVPFPFGPTCCFSFPVEYRNETCHTRGDSTQSLYAAHTGVHLLAVDPGRHRKGRESHFVLLGTVEDDRAAQDQDVRGAGRVHRHRQYFPRGLELGGFLVEDGVPVDHPRGDEHPAHTGLDGGHAIFTFWEMVTGRKVSDKVLEGAQYVGLVIILFLLLYANGNDIYRFFIK